MGRGFFQYIPSFCKMNLSKLNYQVDGVYFDITSFLMMWGQDYSFDENAVKDLIRYVNTIVQHLRPTTLVFFSFEGTQPLQKVLIKNKLKNIFQNVKKVSTHSKGNYKTIIPKNDNFPEFFMMQIEEKMKSDILWKNLKIVCSTPHTPGEAEYKIFYFIDKQIKKMEEQNIDPYKFKYAIVSQDGDSVHLAISHHLENSIIVTNISSEAIDQSAISSIQIQKPDKKEDKQYIFNTFRLIESYMVIDTKLVMEYFFFLMKKQPPNSKDELYHVMDDFTFLSAVYHKDFVPMFIQPKIFINLINKYKDATNGKYITNKTNPINTEVLAHLFTNINQPTFKSFEDAKEFYHLLVWIYLCDYMDRPPEWRHTFIIQECTSLNEDTKFCEFLQNNPSWPEFTQDSPMTRFESDVYKHGISSSFIPPSIQYSLKKINDINYDTIRNAVENTKMDPQHIRYNKIIADPYIIEPNNTRIMEDDDYYIDEKCLSRPAFKPSFFDYNLKNFHFKLNYNQIQDTKIQVTTKYPDDFNVDQASCLIGHIVLVDYPFLQPIKVTKVFDSNYLIDDSEKYNLPQNYFDFKQFTQTGISRSYKIENPNDIFVCGHPLISTSIANNVFGWRTALKIVHFSTVVPVDYINGYWDFYKFSPTIEDDYKNIKKLQTVIIPSETTAGQIKTFDLVNNTATVVFRKAYTQSIQIPSINFKGKVKYSFLNSFQQINIHNLVLKANINNPPYQDLDNDQEIDFLYIPRIYSVYPPNISLLINEGRETVKIKNRKIYERCPQKSLQEYEDNIKFSNYETRTFQLDDLIWEGKNLPKQNQFPIINDRVAFITRGCSIPFGTIGTVCDYYFWNGDFVVISDNPLPFEIQMHETKRLFLAKVSDLLILQVSNRDQNIIEDTAPNRNIGTLKNYVTQKN